MKNVLIKVFATIFIFLFSGFVSVTYSEEWIEKVVVDKEFKINKDAELIIDHEFGNVRCENWDKDIISIVATVKVNTSNSEKAYQIIENVLVEVKGTKSKVEAICDLNQKYRNNKNSKVTIDFDIKMPVTVSLNLENKFGSAYVESVSGPANISSEYGSLEIISLSNTNNSVEVKFGDANIKHMTNGDLEIGYSHLKIAGAEELSIESEYSDISIVKAKSISLELEGGNITIGSVGDFDVESSFANIEIQNLSGSITGETDYGSLTIANVKNVFSSITLLNEYGAISINFEKGSSYSFIADGKYCSIEYPKEEAKISYNNTSHSSTVIKGIVGNESSPASSVTVKSEYGAVVIK